MEANLVDRVHKNQLLDIILRHLGPDCCGLVNSRRTDDLRTGHEKPRRAVEVILYSFFNLGVRWGWVVNGTPRLLYPSPQTHTHTHTG